MTRKTRSAKPSAAAGDAGPPPDEATLNAIAIRHLARYPATRLGLSRVLDRRVDRWLRVAGAVDTEAAKGAADARRAVRAVVARLAESGVVNDAAFAESRARSLGRSGHSRRAVAAHLAARGVAGETVQAVLADDPERELAAALLVARRRRLGPFRETAAQPDTARRELGVLARAGFPHDVALRALRMDVEAAEALVIRLRRQ
jgi:regulatory protein